MYALSVMKHTLLHGVNPITALWWDVRIALFLMYFRKDYGPYRVKEIVNLPSTCIDNFVDFARNYFKICRIHFVLLKYQINNIFILM